jgi:PAS domain S-box-containing protein
MHDENSKHTVSPEKILALHQELIRQHDIFAIKSELFQYFIENHNACIYHFDFIQNSFDYVSDNVLDLTGYPPGHYIHNQITDIYNEFELNEWKDFLETAHNSPEDFLNKKIHSLEQKLKTNYGDYVWIKNHFSVSFDESKKVKDIWGIAVENSFRSEDQVQGPGRPLTKIILDMSPNLIFLKDSKGKILMGNQALANIFEIELDELIDRLNKDFVTDPAESEIYNKNDQQVLEANKTITINEKFTSPSGKKYWFQTTRTPVILPNGEKFVLITSTDISSLRETERQLKRSEQKYRSLIDNLDLHFISTDKHLKISMLNRMAKEFIGDSDNLSGQYVHDIHPARKYLNRALLKQVIQTGKGFKAEEYTENKGQHKWLFHNIQPLYNEDDEVNGLQILSMDITEKKEQEIRTYEKDLEYKGLINASSDSLILLDTDLKVIMLNSAALETTNRSPQELIGKTAREIFKNQAGEKRHKLAIQVKESGKPIRSEEKVNDRFIDIMLYPIFDDYKNIKRIAIMARDITILKEAELATKESLRKEVQLNDLKSGIISTVSHEFRTPLSVILSNIQIMHKYKDVLSEEEYDSKYNIINSSLKHLNYMLDNIALLNKNYSGLLLFNPEVLHFERLIEQIIEEIDSIWQNQNRILFNINSNIGRVKMDEKLLRHILSNLLNNALKYSSDDRNVAIVVSEEDGQYVQIKIIDEGIGIKEEDLQHIWQPFFRGSNSRNMKGTGIGSSIVKSCVEIHNGEIKLESKQGHGTTVIVRLPYKKPDQ